MNVTNRKYAVVLNKARKIIVARMIEATIEGVRYCAPFDHAGARLRNEYGGFKIIYPHTNKLVGKTIKEVT